MKKKPITPDTPIVVIPPEQGGNDYQPILMLLDKLYRKGKITDEARDAIRVAVFNIKRLA